MSASGGKGTDWLATARTGSEGGCWLAVAGCRCSFVSRSNVFLLIERPSSEGETDGQTDPWQHASWHQIGLTLDLHKVSLCDDLAACAV